MTAETEVNLVFFAFDRFMARSVAQAPVRLTFFVSRLECSEINEPRFSHESKTTLGRPGADLAAWPEP